MLDTPYVLNKEDKDEFLATLRDLKFASNYVSSLKHRIVEGKLSGLKTHDFHILMQQVLPLCLRNIGCANVTRAIMWISRLFRKLCAKVVNSEQKLQMLEEVAETIHALEKELPLSAFVIMMHLPIYLIEERFMCGPMHM